MELGEPLTLIVTVLVGAVLISSALIGSLLLVLRVLWKKKFALLFALTPKLLPDKDVLRRQILGHPLTPQIEARYPFAFLLFRTWLDPTLFIRAFLFVFATFAVIVLLLTALGLTIIPLSNVELFDIEAVKAVTASRSIIASGAMILASALGEWYILFLIGIVLSIRWWERRERLFILPFWFIFFQTTLSAALIKLIIGRTRPAFDFTLTTFGFSFPSIHAALALAVGGLLIFYITKTHIHYGFKSVHTLVLAAVVLLVGFSRIYLGVHFPSDVLAGFLTGGLALGAGIYLHSLLKRLLPSPSVPTEPLLSRK